MIIDVIDMEDPKLGGDRRKQLENLNANSVKLTMYGMSNGVEQVMADVEATAPVGGLQVLRIWSHGRPGGQTFTGGHGGEEYRVQHWTGVCLANFDELAPTLATLTQFFSPDGRVELRGCEVAGGTDGEQLLIKLADVWQVPVYGGTDLQYRVQWDGPVVRAAPDGTLTCSNPTPID